jgi:hypothetical protein
MNYSPFFFDTVVACWFSKWQEPKEESAREKKMYCSHAE